MVIEGDNISEDDLMMEALEAGAEDMSTEDEFYEITTEPGDFTAVRGAGIKTTASWKRRSR